MLAQKLLTILQGQEDNFTGERTYQNQFLPFHLSAWSLYSGFAPADSVRAQKLYFFRINYLDKVVKVQSEVIDPQNVNSIDRTYAYQTAISVVCVFGQILLKKFRQFQHLRHWVFEVLNYSFV